MRITGGGARGIRLRVPSVGVRPATDRMREAVFSSLGRRFAGGRFLDLFAGSGAYGLEAWSRGAAGGEFVESHPRVCALLSENVRNVGRSAGLEEKACRVWASDVLRWQPVESGHYMVIFADPPYTEGNRWLPEIVRRADSWLAPDPEARLVLELPGGSGPEFPEGWQIVRKLGKGRGDPEVRIMARSGRD